MQLTPKQREFIYHTGKEAIFSHGPGAGATTALCYRALEVARNYENTRVLLVGSSYSVVRAGIIPTLQQMMQTGERYSHMSNGSAIEVDGLDIFYALQSWRGKGFGFIGVDEPGESLTNLLPMLQSRLRQEPGEIRITQRQFDNLCIPCVTSSSNDNPHLDQKYVGRFEQAFASLKINRYP